MIQGLEYLILRIEAQYFEQNKEVLSKECLNKEKLDCNCITGLIINYAGYMLKQYIKDPKQDVRFAVDDDSFYLKAIYDNKEFFPIRIQDDMKSFYYGDKACSDLKEPGEQARVPFDRCADEEELNLLKQKHKEYVQVNTWAVAMPECYRIEFWVRFLEAMRMVDIKTGEKAFLLMAIFMFPGNTLRTVRQEMAKENFSQEEKNNLVLFLHGYIQFLKDIKSDEPFGFFARFADAFNRAVGIVISELIEDIISRVPQHIICQSFTSAYRNNKEEVSSNTRHMSKLISLLEGQELSECAMEKLVEIKNMISAL